MSALVEQAVMAYAVLLNRPMWLSADRIGAARTVWARLLAEHRDVTLHDIETAIDNLARGDRPGDVLPTHIVTAAANAAIARRVAISDLLSAAEHGYLLLEVQQRFDRLVAAGQRDAADRELDEAEEVIHQLLRGCDDETAFRVLDAVGTQIGRIRGDLPRLARADG